MLFRQIVLPFDLLLKLFAAVTQHSVRDKCRVFAFIRPLPIKRTTGIAPASLLQHPRQRFPLILIRPAKENRVCYSSLCAVVELKPEFSISLIPACVKSVFLTSRFTL